MWNPFSKIYNPDIKAATLRESDSWIVNAYSGSKTSAGQRINNETAMAISTVYDCIRIISEDLAKLPLPVMQELDDGTRGKKKDHTLWNVLNWQPNPEMSAMSFWNTIIAHAVGTGNGYAEKVRDKSGNVFQLWILPPDRVTPKKDANDNLIYEFREDSGVISKISPDKIYHLPGFGYDGIMGYNPVQIARESLGLASAAEMFGAKFFGNGAKTSMALTFPNSLKEQAYNNLKKSIDNQVSGDNQHRVLLVEEGGTVQTLSLSQKDSQYLETRQFSVAEICRWFRVPPHKVADLTHATFSNIEEQNIDFVSDTLMPWFIRVEQTVHNQLLSPQDQKDGYFVKYNANALLRGNSESRSKFYNTAIMAGWMVRNEARMLEDMNPIEGLWEPLMPLNMIVVGEEPISNDTSDNRGNSSSNDAFVEDIASRITAAEERGLSARADKANDDRDRFNEWVTSFYDKQKAYTALCLKPILVSPKTIDWIAMSGEWVIQYAEDPADHIKTWNRKQELKDIINEALTCTHK